MDRRAFTTSLSLRLIHKSGTPRRMMWVRDQTPWTSGIDHKPCLRYVPWPTAQRTTSQRRKQSEKKIMRERRGYKSDSKEMISRSLDFSNGIDVPLTWRQFIPMRKKSSPGGHRGSLIGRRMKEKNLKNNSKYSLRHTDPLVH